MAAVNESWDGRIGRIEELGLHRGSAGSIDASLLERTLLPHDMPKPGLEGLENLSTARREVMPQPVYDHFCETCFADGASHILCLAEVHCPAAL